MYFSNEVTLISENVYPNYVYGPTELLVPVNLNFGEYILDKFLSFPDKICYINGLTQETITYGEMAQQSMNVAVSLSRIGVRKGQIVAICSENRNEYFAAVIGVACTGAVVSTFNPGYTKSELKHSMSISKPNYVICSPDFYTTHKTTLKSLDYVKTVILFGDGKQQTTGEVLCFNDLAFSRNNGGRHNALERNVTYEEFNVADVDGQTDTVFLLYSSGTTGLPKAVMLTHMNIISACCMPKFQDPNVLILVVTPWFHSMGLIGNLFGMSYGRTAVYIPKFDLDLYMRTIEKYKVEHLTVAPPILVALSKTNLKYDISSVRYIYSGAAPLRNDIIEALRPRFPKADHTYVLQGYGMTEVTLAAVRNTFDEKRLAKPGAVGVIVPNTTIKIVDLETRKPLGPNQRGEICIKGCQVMKGYVGKPREDDFDEEGFFRTGDIGYYDEDRVFYVVDRLKELIKYKGFQVAPAELEALILQHPGVKDVGVVGIDHSSSGEVPLAFVVKQTGVEVTEKEVKDFVAERLSNPKHLRGGVRFVEQIPKNPSGKILRKVLRSMAKSGKSKL